MRLSRILHEQDDISMSSSHFSKLVFASFIIWFAAIIELSGVQILCDREASMRFLYFCSAFLFSMFEIDEMSFKMKRYEGLPSHWILAKFTE